MDSVDKCSGIGISEQVFPDNIYVSGTHSYAQITGGKIFEEIGLDFFEAGQGHRLARFRGVDQCRDVRGMDSEIVGFPCGIDLSQHHPVGKGQGLRELRHEGLGPGVGVGLEGDPQRFVGALQRRLERSLDLLRMMCIVVDDHYAVQFALDLKSAVDAAEPGDAVPHRLLRDPQYMGRGDGRQRVPHVVDARDL